MLQNNLWYIRYYNFDSSWSLRCTFAFVRMFWCAWYTFETKVSSFLLHYFDDRDLYLFIEKEACSTVGNKFRTILECSCVHFWFKTFFEETNKCFEGSTHALPPYLRTRVLVIKNDTHPLCKIIFGYVRYMVYFLQIPLNAHQMLLAELKRDVPATRTYRDLNVFRMQKKGDYF